jgi:peptidoglycan/LPS O-acetylase OafA/YrhL
LLCLTLFNENIFYLFGYFAPGHSDNRLVYFYSSLPHLLLAGYLVFIFSYYDSVGKIVLGNSFAVMLGNFSFSIYLLHDPIFYFLNSIGLFAFLGPNTGLLISILLIIIFSSLTYSFVEVPSRKNLKTMLMDRYRFIIDNMSPSQSNL